MFGMNGINSSKDMIKIATSITNNDSEILSFIVLCFDKLSDEGLYGIDTIKVQY